MESVPFLSSQDGSGRVQLKDIGPTRNRKVVGSNPTSASSSYRVPLLMPRAVTEWSGNHERTKGAGPAYGMPSPAAV